MTAPRWEAADLGNQRMDDQRDQVLTDLVAGIGQPVRRALDVGCGRGQALAALGLRGIGVDIGLVRLRLAAGPVAQGDATRLPFPAASFDLVLAANAFSSIPAAGARQLAAAEVRRVLAPAGVVLWYDQRWPNPVNPGTRQIDRRELGRLFPDATFHLAPVTVVPALARAFPRRYDALHRITPLRSHLIGTIRFS